MLAGMLVQVDQLGGGLNSGERGALYRCDIPDERDDSAVVVGVAAGVEHVDRRGLLHGADDSLNDIGPAAFAKVRDALHERSFGCHTVSRGALVTRRSRCPFLLVSG